MCSVVNWVQRNRVVLHYLAGAMVVGLGIWLSLHLLKNSMIDSDNFVILITVSMVFGIAVAMLPGIAEISTGSLSLKLNQAQKEAEVTLQKLQEQMVEVWRPQVIAATQHSGGFSSLHDSVEERATPFFRLLEAIEKTGCRHGLENEIQQTAETIAYSQLQLIYNFNDECEAKLGLLLRSLPPVEEVRVKALNPSGIEKAATRLNYNQDELLEKICQGLDAYQKLRDNTRLKS